MYHLPVVAVLQFSILNRQTWQIIQYLRQSFSPESSPVLIFFSRPIVKLNFYIEMSFQTLQDFF